MRTFIISRSGTTTTTGTERMGGARPRALVEAGHRSSEPRAVVVDLLGRQRCVSTAREISDGLRAEGTDVGTATVYRTLELLLGLGLLTRIDTGQGPALYEPADPSGEHHHHIVCERCGQVGAFEDEELERAIGVLAARLEYEVGGHEVVLRGQCPPCQREESLVGVEDGR